MNFVNTNEQTIIIQSSWLKDPVSWGQFQFRITSDTKVFKIEQIARSGFEALWQDFCTFLYSLAGATYQCESKVIGFKEELANIKITEEQKKRILETLNNPKNLEKISKKDLIVFLCDLDRKIKKLIPADQKFPSTMTTEELRLRNLKILFDDDESVDEADNQSDDSDNELFETIKKLQDAGDK